ncbi:MAG: glycoside hydrolase family 13 protein, partial [Acidobacteriota bacterium]
MRCRPLARLVLPTLVVLPLLFLLAAAPALAGPRTVDGDPSDWTGVASPVAHTDANPADAWIYTGVVGDRRTEPGMTDASDLVELRLTADATNLYVLARLADVAAGTVGDVHVALGFDATHSPLAGAAELASLGDDTGLTFAGRPFIRHETLVLLRTSNGATPVVDVFAGGAWTNPAGAQIAISQANDLVEASVPLAALGLTNTADVIVTAATFRNQPGAPAAADTTAAFADHDAIDSLGLPGQLGDADARDLDDGAIDRGWWLRFQGAVDAPTAIVWDGLYHSSCDQFRLTACASSDHPADENLPNDNNIPSGDPPTFQEAQRWGGGGTIPGRATDVYVYDDEPMVLSALALAGDVPDGATNPRILFFGSGATVDMTAQEDWTGSWHGAVERTYTIFQGAIPPQPPGDVFYSFQIEDGAGTRSLCRTNGGPATALERTAIGQWVSADGCAFADYAYSVLDDDTSGPTIENVQLLPPEGLGNSVCADIVDAIPDSGDNDSGFGSALVRYSANKADVLAGAGTTAAFALQGGDTYCATTATFTDPTYYRVEAFNGDSDGPADNDASRSSVLCFGASCVLGAPGDNDIRWSEVLHDTRDLFYRAPFGAIEAETPLVLRLRTAQDDLSDAAVRVYATPLGDITLTMTQVVESDPTYDWWEVALPTDATAQPSQLFYKFLLFDGTASAWYIDDYSHNSYDHEDRFENGRGMVVEDGEAPAFFGNSFNITVYDPGFTTPAWSQGATIYQILPDRFRNGDPSNDSAWPYGDVYGTPIFLHSTWNEAPVNTRDPADPFFNQWSADFFGGDLQGVMDELDTLSELGVTAIYFNPIFSAPSNHGYDTTDYLRVSPRYGTNDDFAALADAAEARGIKIILDGVFNHSGSDSIYLDRASHWDVDGNPASGNDGSGACEGPGSPYAAFFNLFGTDGPCYDGLNYDSWFGFDTLPLLIDFVPGNIVRDFVFDFDGDGDNGLTAGPDATPGVIQHWYELGADGWRFDVADELPHDFWIAFREQVKNQDGWDGPLYSEVWYEAVPWVFGDQMDATMNYRFRKAVLGFLVDSDFVDNDSNGEQTIWQLPATDFDTVLTAIREDYPEVAWRTMMNLMGSHDTNRPLFVLGERSSDYAAAVAKMKMMAAIMFSYPGAPTVYFGDEVGIGAAAHGGPHLWGAGFVSDGILQDDPHNRHPFPWRPDAEDPYAQRVDDAFESVTGVLPATLPADDLRDHYATLGRLRRAVPVFAAGDVVTLLADDATEVYAYALVDDTLAPPCAVAVHNRSATTRTVSLTGLPAACSGLTF